MALDGVEGSVSGEGFDTRDQIERETLMVRLAGFAVLGGRLSILVLCDEISRLRQDHSIRQQLSCTVA